MGTTQANKAFVTYCSSDAWVGDGANYGFQFRGQRIVSAVLASFVQKQGMGAAPGHRLIFGGCSAGGRGAAFNIDYVAGIIAAAGAANPVDVVGLLDAALWIDIPPAVPGIISQQCQTAALADMVNASSRYGDACAAAYPGAEAWKCLYGQVRTIVVAQHTLALLPHAHSTLTCSVRPAVSHAVHHDAVHYAGQPAGHIPN